MIVEFQIKNEKLAQILRARAVAARPCISNSFYFSGETYHVAWVDVGDEIFIHQRSEPVTVTLNTLVEGKVMIPATGGFEFIKTNQWQVSFLSATAHLCSRTAMKQSNNDQAPTMPVQIGIDFDLVVVVNEDGRPRLCATPSNVSIDPNVSLTEAEQEQFTDFVQNAFQHCIWLDLRGLSTIPGADVPIVINAGIQGDSERTMIRFEFVPPDADAAERWDLFYAFGGVTDLMLDQEWGMVIPKEIIEPAVAQILTDNLQGNTDFSLESSVNASWSPWGIVPRMVVTFSGEAIDACVDIDMDVDVTLGVLFTVPQPNVLRNSVVLSWELADFWEEFGCVITNTLFWPIAGAMMIEQGKLEWGHFLAGLAGGGSTRFLWQHLRPQLRRGSLANTHSPGLCTGFRYYVAPGHRLSHRHGGDSRLVVECRRGSRSQ